MAESNQSNQTEAAKLGLNLTLEPVESFIFRGVQRQFYRVFDKCPAIWTTSDDKVQALKKLFKDKAKSYPHAYLMLNGLTRVSDRGNARMMAMRGSQSVVTTDNKKTYRVHYVPIDFAVGVEFITNDYAKVLQFASAWMFGGQSGWMKFNVVYGRTTFDVATALSENISLPQRAADLDNVPEYTVACDMVIHGYMSNPVLLEQQIIDEVHVDGVLQQGDAKTTVWSFKRSGITHEDPEEASNTNQVG